MRLIEEAERPLDFKEDEKEKSLKLKSEQECAVCGAESNSCRCPQENDEKNRNNDLAEKPDSQQSKQTTRENQDKDLPDLGEPYEVLCEVGHGGMGRVYKIRDTRLDKIMAAKVVQSDLARDQSAMKHFKQEAEAASKLQHPNLISVYECRETPSGEPFILMDYLEGKSLDEILVECGGTMHFERALNIMTQICEALSYAHSNGVLHRDIKPSNIIISTTESGEEIAKIVDFGIAKILPAANRETQDLTETGEVFGSPHYMSPEQCLGFMLDKRSDIYSLGCLMYEVMTGAPPFGGANPIQVVVKHINEDVEPFKKTPANKKVVDYFENITMHCLEKDKSNRYQNVDEILMDLHKVKNDKKPPTYQREIKKNRKFTSKQVAGIVTTLMLAVPYCLWILLSGTGGSEFTFCLIVGILSLIGAIGSWTFYSIAIEKFKQVKDFQASYRIWWSGICLFFAGSAVAAFLPVPLTIFSYSLRAPVGSICMTIHMICMIAFLISLTGYFLFRSSKITSLLTVVFQYVVVLIVVSLISLFGFPNQVASGLDFFSDVAKNYSEPLSEQLDYLSLKIGKKDSRIFASLAIKAQRNEKYEDAIKYYSKAIDYATTPYEKSRYLQNRADLYLERIKPIKPGENNAYIFQVVNDLNRAYQIYPSSPLASKIAELDYNHGNKEEAFNILDTEIKRDGRNSHSFETRLKLNLKEKNYAQVLNDVDHILLSNNSSNIQRHILILIRANMLEKLGQKEAAMAEYAILPRLSSSNVMRKELFAAYGQYKLGDVESAEKTLAAANSERSNLEGFLKGKGIELDLDW